MQAQLTKQLEDANRLAEKACMAIEMLHHMLDEPVLSERIGPTCLSNIQSAVLLLDRIQLDFCSAARDQIEGLFDD